MSRPIERAATPRVLVLLLVLAATAVLVSVLPRRAREAAADEGPNWKKGLPRQHNSKWLVLDDDRPKPPVVTPAAQPGGPPSDAVVLFDGTDLSKWNGSWKVENGYMEVNATGSISSKDEFGDCQIHLEYMAPTPVKGKSQARGNSGIIIMGRYEIQILDSHDNESYAEGYIGAVYGQHPPLVNAARKPGEWQSYDIIFRRPRYKDGLVVEPGRATVLLNGVLVQHNAEIYGEVAYRQLAAYPKETPGKEPVLGPIVLQDHGDKQSPRFRNIWVRRLDLSPEAIDNQG
jgi:hypothetical protein